MSSVGKGFFARDAVPTTFSNETAQPPSILLCMVLPTIPAL